MWALCGIWDALRDNNVSLARARVALSVAQLDQQAVDRGSWLVAGEISLEDPPPYSSFSTHRGVEPWESPHSRLLDERWLELILSKLKDIADFQEKKLKLSSNSKKGDEAVVPEPKPKPKPGKGSKGEGKGAAKSEAPPPQN